MKLLIKLSRLALLASVATSAAVSVAQAQIASDPNTVALWLFDETNYTCTPLLDASQNRYDLRLLDSGQLAAGKYGRCLRMLADTNYHAYYSEWDGTVAPNCMGQAEGQPAGLWGPTITPGKLVSAFAGLEWTCEFWLKLASAPGTQAAVLHLGYAYDPGLSIDLCGNGGYFQLTNAYGGWWATCPMQNSSLTDGGWHHVALVSSATGVRVQLYLDGQVQTNSTRTAIAGSVQPVPATIYPASLATSCGLFDSTLNYELFRLNRFNLSLGENRHGQADLDSYMDELRISSVARYSGNFTPPGSFSCNYASNPPAPSVVTGPPLLFGPNAPSGTVQLGGRRHLFIDGALLDTTNNVQWVVNTPPVDAMGHLGQGDYSAVDNAGQVWLVMPDSYGSAQGLTAVWTSSDGTNFTAPNLGVVNYQGSTNNNYILSGLPLWCTAFKDRNPNIPAAQQFKMSAFVANAGIELLTSPDMVHWSRNETLMLPLIGGGGAEMYFDDQNGQYQFYMRRDGYGNSAGCGHTNRSAVGFTNREVTKAWSFKPLAPPDFAGWSSPVVTCEGPTVFGLTAYGEVWRSRAVKYAWAPDVYLAFPWRAPVNVVSRQTELAVSRDGVNWSFLAPLGMYLPIGMTVGGLTVSDCASQEGLIRRGNAVWQYAEFRTAAGAQFNGRLVQRLDGFVSVDTTSTAGTVVTRPLVFAGSMLTLNLDSHSGVTRVAILDTNSNPIAGYGLSDCDPITTNLVNAIVTWHGSSSLSNLAGSTVRLELQMTQTKLYALQFGQPGPAVVDSLEYWNGLDNPHAVDGVTLTGAGTPANPYVYTLPAGMTITANGYVQLSASTNDDFSIRFQFSSGNLQMDAGAVIDTQRPVRTGSQNFIIDMANGDITGAGSIIGLRGTDSNRKFVPHIVTITNANNISLASIDYHVENAGAVQPDFLLSATGNITITGAVNFSDTQASGGNNAPSVTIRAAAANLGSVDTRALRNDGAANNGNVTLQALSPAHNYDPTQLNGYTNRLILNGLITTAGGGAHAGNVTLQAVVQQARGGYGVSLAGGAALTFQAGKDNLGTPDKDLFINASAQNPAVAYVVNWDGAGPSGSGPSFTTNPVVLSSALAGVAYSNSIAGMATNSGINPLTFAKGAGPVWLFIATNGVLSGTPASGDVGTNTWTVSVTDGTHFGLATLQIKVGSRPAFTANPIVKPNANRGVAYSGTLANVAQDLDGGTLQFAKESGPDWLTVGADGTLSGTPGASDTFTNYWIVSVTDGTSSAAAMLVINVCGQPKFLTSPVVMADAYAGNNYSVSTQTLATAATDPCGQPLTFTKASGPAWLVVSSPGALSGIPNNTNAGLNTWTVTASNGTYGVSGTLTILVHSAPVQVVISAHEQWDGTNNPHAADGVTLSGSGTIADPAVYIIPAGIHITSTGGITMSTPPPAGGQDQPPDNTITLQFLSGDLQMDSGGYINIARRSRSGAENALITMGGGNITGAGQINGLWDNVSTPRILTINNVSNVNFSAVDLHVESTTTSGRHLNIIATGSVNVPGTIDNSDQDSSGDPAGNVTIQAATMTLGAIDTTAHRSDGSAANGSIFLYALSPGGGYGKTQGTWNTISNKLTIAGLLNTKGVSIAGGNVTLQGTVVQFNPGFSVSKPTGASVTLDAGQYPKNGAVASDVFKDYVGSGLTPAYDVQWSGAFTAPPQPMFTNHPLTRANAPAGVNYSGSGQTLAGSATNGAGTLTYGKTSGPGWLQVAPGGALSGTPGSPDVGVEAWSIYVTDGNLYDTNRLTITVTSGASGGPAVVSGVEVWDGNHNPHAADGVTLTVGNGWATNPSVYYIPHGLYIAGSGEIDTDPGTPGAQTNSIVFCFIGGDLAMEYRAVINVARYSRDLPANAGSLNPLFIISGSAGGAWPSTSGRTTNNITGAGSIKGLKSSTDTPRSLWITNMNNVTFSNVDCHVENIASGHGPVNIRAWGDINIIDTVSNSDIDTGGGNGVSVFIYGQSVTVSNVSNEPWRDSVNAGQISLRGVSPATQAYSTTDPTNNWWPGNKVTVNGKITQYHPGVVAANGNAINIQGVVVQLGSTFTNIQAVTNTGGTKCTLNVNAGVPGGGLGTNNLLINNSGVRAGQYSSGSTTTNIFTWLVQRDRLTLASNTAAGLTFTWPHAAAHLQQTTNANVKPGDNGWVDVPGATSSPYTIPRTNAAGRFFHLRLN